MALTIELHADSTFLNGETFEVVAKRILRPEELPPPGTGVRFIEPVTATVLVVSAAVLAERIVMHWLRGKEQGVELDLRKTPSVVSRLAGTPAGFVVVIKPDGTSEVMQAKYDTPAQLAGVIEAITKSLGREGA